MYYYTTEPQLNTMSQLHTKPVELTEDEKLKQTYISLMVKHLEHCKIYDPYSYRFNTEDKRAIEYYLKDVSHRPVKQDYSQDQCVKVFEERIVAMITNKASEWEAFRELVERYENIIEHLAKDIRLIIYYYQ